MTERELINRVESANVDEFVDLLGRLSPGDEQALMAYFGAARFARLKEFARPQTRAAKKGNVVVLHGIMGGGLSLSTADVDRTEVWLSIFRLIRGWFDRLALDAEGRSLNRVEPSGILKRFYGEQLLRLNQNWNVRAYSYDWRLDISTLASNLDLKIREWFGNEPVHLVAHSMGGLIARAYTVQFATRWQAMWDAANPEKGGRLIMLGTPNNGSFEIPQLLSGLNGNIRKLALLDFRHSKADLLQIVKSFVSPYQMLPRMDLGGPEIRQLYDPATYGALSPAKSRFDRAEEFHRSIQPAADPARMVYIAGYGQATLCGIKPGAPVDSPDSYFFSDLGDGTVPHNLGLLANVPAYYIREEHGALPVNAVVMDAMEDLLAKGATERLEKAVPAGVRADNDDALRTEYMNRARTGEDLIRAISPPFRTDAESRSAGDADEPGTLSREEGELEELLLFDSPRGHVAPAPADVAPAPAGGVNFAPLPSLAGPPEAKISIRMRVVHGDIANPAAPSPVSIDAISVGHYLGVRPDSAELALDKAISGNPADRSDYLLTQFTDHGVIRGDLGEFFPLPHPTDPGKLIVIAGMGLPGRFGIPELTALSRELAWTLARLERKHLATVVIGSGEGNLSLRSAIGAWIQGVRQAGAAANATLHLPEITFVEFNPRRAVEILYALQEFGAEFTAAKSPNFTIEVADPFDSACIDQLIAEARSREEAAFRKAQERRDRRRATGGWESDEEANSESPTRLTVSFANRAYRFSVITSDASIPQRELQLDPDLVNEANDELVARPVGSNNVLRRQGQIGRYLQKLLIPSDLEQTLAPRVPLVISCDATCARLHWEMVAQPGLLGGADDLFLGIDRSLTRQLMTSFAPAPEAATASNRPIRVLIIGDPAADRPLKGALAEAQLVRDLFEEYKRSSPTRPIEIVALLGPAQATRNRVMQELILNRFDVLHYAGHCVFDKANPSDSGWLFTGGKRLSAYELDRIPRVPSFVFSNACESGITPDRADLRSASLGPSFAEAFFARGVQNFVCTGWPVHDTAAYEFADRFYRGLLGLRGAGPEAIHTAMREARRGIHTAARPHGFFTWGAYQHYGDPYFRLLRR